MTKSSLNAVFFIRENKAILFLKNGGHITYLQGAANLPLFLFVSFERNPFLFGLRLPLNALNCKHIHIFTKSRIFFPHMTLPLSLMNTWTPPPQSPPLSPLDLHIFSFLPLPGHDQKSLLPLPLMMTRGFSPIIHSL